MNMLPLIVTALTVPAFAKYDPFPDRAALRQAAINANDSASRAAAVPLLPDRAGDIKSALDESVVQADLAANAAKNLETGAAKRAGEMAGELKGRGEPAPSSAANDLASAAAVQRGRWKTLTQDHDGLQSRVDALPSSPDKASLSSLLSTAGAALAAADASLNKAAADAGAMATAVSDMELAQKRAAASAAELSEADGEVVRLAASLPPLVDDAKAATALLGQEPQGPNRTKAGAKISAPRDVTGPLYSAADRASNRADDHRSRSDSFARAQTAFESARGDAAGAPDAAKKSLDDASASQDQVKACLDHPRP